MPIGDDRRETRCIVGGFPVGFGDPIRPCLELFDGGQHLGGTIDAGNVVLGQKLAQLPVMGAGEACVEEAGFVRNLRQGQRQLLDVLKIDVVVAEIGFETDHGNLRRLRHDG